MTIMNYDKCYKCTLISSFSKNLNQSMDSLSKVEDLGRNTTQRILVANLTLVDLHGKLDMLSNTAQGLRDNATQLQESNVEGTFFSLFFPFGCYLFYQHEAVD